MRKDVAQADATLHRVVPASDIVEREEGFHILLDVPGITKDSLSIEIEENELTVVGRSGQSEAGNRQAVHREFGGVEFARTFTLTDMVDKDRIVATFNHGVLDLYLPRAEAAKPRRISISE